jgi:hypothetical protein
MKPPNSEFRWYEVYRPIGAPNIPQMGDARVNPGFIFRFRLEKRAAALDRLAVGRRSATDRFRSILAPHDRQVTPH